MAMVDIVIREQVAGKNKTQDVEIHTVNFDVIPFVGSLIRFTEKDFQTIKACNDPHVFSGVSSNDGFVHAKVIEVIFGISPEDGMITIVIDFNYR